MALAAFLESQPHVTRVHYPGLTSHPHHSLAARLFRPGAFGGMLAFELGGGTEAAGRWCEALELAWMGASLGGPTRS